MSELQNRVNVIRNSMETVGLRTAHIDWQCFAVCLTVSSERERVIAKLFDAGSGWFRDGISRRYKYYQTSLYLSPKGMPFYVGYAEHEQLYDGIMGCSQHKMNMAGWIHVSGGDCRISKRPTSMQLAWLERNKHRVRAPNLDRPDWTEVEEYPKAARFDVMPMVELDWDRLERRIRRAMSPDTLDPAVLPERMNVPCPAPNVSLAQAYFGR
jgi:hypothetical protein